MIDAIERHMKIQEALVQAEVSRLRSEQLRKERLQRTLDKMKKSSEEKNKG